MHFQLLTKKRTLFLHISLPELAKKACERKYKNCDRGNKTKRQSVGYISLRDLPKFKKKGCQPVGAAPELLGAHFHAPIRKPDPSTPVAPNHLHSSSASPKRAMSDASRANSPQLRSSIRKLIAIIVPRHLKPLHVS